MAIQRSKRGSRSGPVRRLRLGRPWCEAIELRDGRRLILRPIQPCDRRILQRSFTHLSPQEVRFRFLHPIRELTDDYARRLTELDPVREFALVLIEPLPPEEARIVAVARAALDQSGRDAEFAIIVAREISGQGLATWLLGRVIEWCRKKRLESVYGNVLAENRAMLAVARNLGFDTKTLPDDPGVVRVYQRLRPAPA